MQSNDQQRLRLY